MQWTKYQAIDWISVAYAIAIANSLYTLNMTLNQEASNNNTDNIILNLVK